jgi:carboxylesterase
MKRPNWILPAAGALAASLLLACEINPVECDDVCQETWMDGSAKNDTSLVDTLHHYLISKRKDQISDSAKAVTPVIIAAHGFTASTYEWLELRNYAGDTLRDPADTQSPPPKALISLVTLGGHGQDIEDFQSSTWKDWGEPIFAEYDALVKLGYKRISIAGASTGCPLILEHVDAGRFDRQPPVGIFLIDPIVSPTAKMLSLIGVFGPIVGNSPSQGNELEVAHWYTNRPAEALDELYSLVNRIKNKLEDGITLPKGTQAKVWKAEKDGSADPIGALLLYKGLKPSGGGRIEVEMVNTRRHVFTRLAGRVVPPATLPQEAYDLQKETFDEMLERAAE